MHRAWKIALNPQATRALTIAILVVAISAILYTPSQPVAAQSTFDFNITLNGYSLSVAPNHSGYVQVTVSLVSGTARNVNLTSTVSPQDGLLSGSFAQPVGTPPFVTTFVVSALNATPGMQYQITISGASHGLVKQAPVLTVTISCAGGSCSTLTTTTVGDGTTNPSCPSGCSETVGQAMNVNAVAEPNWTFSGWNVTGTACSGGADANPCIFTMPTNPVALTANFVQYQQTLYTTYTGNGHVSPACPGGCSVEVGAQVSIVATPAPGWVVSGYQITSGLSCGSQPGYVCTFIMPNFPVTFQVTFQETTQTARTTVIVASTVQTSVTYTTELGSTTTSTITTSTLSMMQTGSTQTSTAYSTTGLITTETESALITQLWTASITTTSVATTLGNPNLELTLAAVILFSILMIGISLIRRSPRRGYVTCTKCGAKNEARMKFCVNCGQSLKGH